MNATVTAFTVALALLGEPHFAPETDTSTTTVVDAYGIYGADATETEMIDDAMDTFADAGLALPERRIYVHDSLEPCRDNIGLWGKGGDKERIDLCMVESAVLLHELAHAWEHHAVSDATRDAFMERTDSGTWNDHDIDHHSRGIEKAAYLVAWSLEDQPIPRMSAGHYAEDLELYELLTGTTSPRVAHWNTESGPVSDAALEGMRAAAEASESSPEFS